MPDQYYSEVFQYRIDTNSWAPAPSLSARRWMHSSCAVDRSIYVCGGWNESYEYYGSIERLTIMSSESGAAVDSQWQILSISTPKLIRFMMVPVSASEIIFLGGQGAVSHMGRITQLDLTDLTLKIVASGSDDELSFISSQKIFTISKSGEITTAANYGG